VVGPGAAPDRRAVVNLKAKGNLMGDVDSNEIMDKILQCAEAMNKAKPPRHRMVFDVETGEITHIDTQSKGEPDGQPTA
jgi:hypothetical protein